MVQSGTTSTRSEFEGKGLEPFVFEMKDGRSGTMSYYTAPEEIYDDHDELKTLGDPRSRRRQPRCESETQKEKKRKRRPQGRKS